MSISMNRTTASPVSGARRWRRVAVLALTAALAPAAWGTPEAAPPARRAAQVPQAEHAVMLALTRVGSRVIAVGERGIILVSTDGGGHWHQAEVPISVTLTCVQMVDASQGWAAGHAGIVLHTVDGGEHWTQQLDGATAAELALKEADVQSRHDGTPSVPSAKESQPQTDGTAVNAAPAGQGALMNARRLVREGADKPFLSLWFVDALHGTVVGAYGLAMHTDDGGRTWQSWTARVGDPHGLHLYAVRQRGDAIWVAGEQGFVAHSTDAGASFNNTVTPYKGSFFALGIGNDGSVVLGGLRSNAVRSEDAGATFRSFQLGGDAAVIDIDHQTGGTWLLALQNGQVFESQDNFSTYHAVLARPQYRLNAVIGRAGGEILGAGFAGVQTLVHGMSSGQALRVEPARASVTVGAE